MHSPGSVRGSMSCPTLAATSGWSAAPESASCAGDGDLLASLDRLSYEQRTVLVWRYWADWDEASIADALGCRPNTVRSHVRRALALLRVVLQLGTNGTVSRREYDAVLAEVSDLPRVVVMTVKADRPWIQANNEIIRSLPLTHPNVVVLDWEARAAEVADHLASDGIHLGDDVAKAFYTNLILEALGLPTS